MENLEDLDKLRAAGVDVKRPEKFTLTLAGERMYELIQILEKRAVEAGDYYPCRECVLFAEHIRAQVKRQGF